LGKIGYADFAGHYLRKPPAKGVTFAGYAAANPRRRFWQTLLRRPPAKGVAFAG
jgi:hypothetical protein